MKAILGEHLGEHNETMKRIKATRDPLKEDSRIPHLSHSPPFLFNRFMARSRIGIPDEVINRFKLLKLLITIE